MFIGEYTGIVWTRLKEQSLEKSYFIGPTVLRDFICFVFWNYAVPALRNIFCSFLQQSLIISFGSRYEGFDLIDSVSINFRALVRANRIVNFEMTFMYFVEGSVVQLNLKTQIAGTVNYF